MTELRIITRMIGPFACIPPCLMVGLVHRETGISNGVIFFIIAGLFVLSVPAVLFVPKLRRIRIPAAEPFLVGGFLFLMGALEVHGIARQLLLAMAFTWLLAGLVLGTVQVCGWYRRRAALPDDPEADPVAQQAEVMLDAVERPEFKGPEERHD